MFEEFKENKVTAGQEGIKIGMLRKNALKRTSLSIILELVITYSN